MRSSVFLITGFPGTGKLTVARALAARLEADGETTLIIDNHWINNPIFGLIDQDGLTPLPPQVWDRVGEIALAVVKTAEELTPRNWNVIFTAYLDGVTDTGWVPRLAEVAETRGASFTPVRLLCDTDEIARRAMSPERRDLMKSVDPDDPHLLAAKGPVYDSGHGNTLALDITTLPPAEAAAHILAHREEIDAGFVLANLPDPA